MQHGTWNSLFKITGLSSTLNKIQGLSRPEFFFLIQGLSGFSGPVRTLYNISWSLSSQLGKISHGKVKKMSTKLFENLSRRHSALACYGIQHIKTGFSGERVKPISNTVDPVINDPAINDLLSPTTFFSCTEHFSIVNDL